MLWKKSKKGEIKYPSKWGLGRIGWHLECSVMATDVLGDNFDIHSGGIDLVFPHHQNEIFQANAYSNDPDSKWVNYFLHSGHLNIQGLKMSKSLKNFVSIKDYLENIGTARELRLLFLMHSWDKPLDYSMDTIDGAKWVDKRITDFIGHLDFIIKEDSVWVCDKTNNNEFEESIYKLVDEMNKDLKDNFNTSKFMKSLLENITHVYKYLDTSYDKSLIEMYRSKLGIILSIFGLDYYNSRGYNGSNGSQVEGNNNIEPFIELSIDLREDFRKVVMKYKKEIPKEAMKEFFQILDDFRDVKLKNLGIELQDRTDDKKTKFVYK